jgi:hypothetical protein
MGWQDAPLANDPWAKFVPAQQPASSALDPWAQFVPSQPSGATGPAWAQAPLYDAAAPLDKYQQAAVAERDAANKAGGGDVTSYGLSGQMLNGAMFGALPTVMGALTTPFEMAKHGTWDPSEGYEYAKANQNLALADTNANHPIAGPVANIAGGVLSGAGLANAGLTFASPGRA